MVTAMRRVIIHDHRRTSDVDSELEAKVRKSLWDLKMQFDSLHAERLGAEKRARDEERKNGKTAQSAAAWQLAARVSTEERRAQDELKSRQREARALGIKL